MRNKRTERNFMGEKELFGVFLHFLCLTPFAASRAFLQLL
jgi:hypothetical protein